MTLRSRSDTACGRSARSSPRTRGRAGRRRPSRCARPRRARGPYSEWWNVRLRAQRSAAASVIAALLSQAMAATPSGEPWSTLLQAGARTGGSCARPREAPRGATGRCPERVAPGRASQALSRRGHRAPVLAPARGVFAAWAGPTIVTTGPPRASRCASTCRRSTSSAATQGASALSLPDKGARPGPGAGARRASGWSSRCVRPSTTATRRARPARRSGAGQHRADQPRHAPRRHPPPPRRLGRPVRQPGGRGRSTRPTSIAACSARTSPTSSAACAVSPPHTGPSRASCSPRRRSPTRVELAERLTGLRGRRAHRRRRLARAAAADRRLESAADRRGARHARARRSARRPSCWRELVRDGARTICFMKSRKGVEVLGRLVQDELDLEQRPELAELVAPYRAGYTAAAAARARGRG